VTKQNQKELGIKCVVRWSGKENVRKYKKPLVLLRRPLPFAKGEIYWTRSDLQLIILHETIKLLKILFNSSKSLTQYLSPFAKGTSVAEGLILYYIIFIFKTIKPCLKN